ncbi:MAG: bifunctional diaminohydroxyphosphoribosylaminopyrimidine deaminase/5-amino-6-(5-phosphoribosylamino)uracil reductase RibD [Halieaceae bacterium]|jgi:diaminohydroxyphosphoribosylaminopyrimidine deaminase/5-amino-6-(5-phosphoribosylamino)uracil reductase|nr:bifunctional diaminohydroxyphosphoribosylaminopyrimidine deaminase/5-amino-6-(5-phosphoribosylamino)uracil reductase RibD [Halieaceae bacterium]
MFTDADRQYMQQALDCALQARFTARPNPAVGCVLVRDGQVIGCGWTQPVGGPHAEVEALRQAGDARGATAYVTLEPCAHHGRTGPCADALVAAGVARVVAAVEDPDPRVAGGGMARLRAAGIQVDVGLLADAAEQQLAGFLLRMRRGWGRVRLKVAASLDGRSAMASGESQWITGAEARADVQLLRAASCAIVTGVGTVLADDCRLTVRGEQLPLAGEAAARALSLPPLRVVLDSQARAPASAAIFAGSRPGIRLVADDLPEPPADAVPIAKSPLIGLDLTAVMVWLGEQACNEILVEAGPTLAGALLEAGLVDELVWYTAPKLLGNTARPFAAFARESLADAVTLNFREITPMGDDLRIIATPEL